MCGASQSATPSNILHTPSNHLIGVYGKFQQSINRFVVGLVAGFVKIIKYFIEAIGRAPVFSHTVETDSSKASMPTGRYMPRSAEYRYYYRCLEIYEGTPKHTVMSQLIALRSCPSSSCRRKILCIIASSLCIVSVQNEINRKAITVFYPTQQMQIWDDEMFLKIFRFRREQFTELLKAFRLGNKSILCDRKGRRAQYFPADVCLMVVIRRFAFPCRFVDLVNIFGLPTHRICDIFHSTMKDTEAPPTYIRSSVVSGAATGWRRVGGRAAPRLDSCAAA